MAVQAALQVHSWNKTKWDDIGQGQTRGHVLWGEKHITEIGLKDVPLDLCHGTKWVKNSIVNLSSFTKGTPTEGNHVKCYTDGSQINEATGWGYIMYEQGISYQGHSSLGHCSSVFQAEVTAIMEVAKALLPITGKEIVFFVDSQAALYALNALTFQLTVVEQCMDTLNTLSKVNFATLHWVRAHVGHELNEKADALAKSRTRSITESIPPFPSKQLEKELFLSKWTDRWSRTSPCQQTKYWVGTYWSLGHCPPG